MHTSHLRLPHLAKPEIAVMQKLTIKLSNIPFVSANVDFADTK